MLLCGICLISACLSVCVCLCAAGESAGRIVIYWVLLASHFGRVPRASFWTRIARHMRDAGARGERRDRRTIARVFRVLLFHTPHGVCACARWWGLGGGGAHSTLTYTRTPTLRFNVHSTLVLNLTLIRGSLCTTPPLLPGFALFKSPRSNPPLPEGRLDFLKGPRSNPPLPEGRLDIRKSPRSNPPYRFQETLQKRSE